MSSISPFMLFCPVEEERRVFNRDKKEVGEGDLFPFREESFIL